jgi:hypothetical protein
MWTRKQQEEIEYLAGVIQQGKMIGASYLQIAGRIVETDLPGLGWVAPPDREPRSTRWTLPDGMKDRILEVDLGNLSMPNVAKALKVIEDLKDFLVTAAEGEPDEPQREVDPTDDEVAAFKQAWHEQNNAMQALPSYEAQSGDRTRAGLRAALSLHDRRV